MNLRKRVIESTIIAVMLTVVTAVTAVMQTASVENVPEPQQETKAVADVQADGSAGIIEELASLGDAATEQASIERADVVVVAEAQEEEPQLSEEQQAWNSKLMADVDDFLYIRSSADGESEVIGKLYKGAAADIVETLDGWYHITSGSVDGYVKSEYCVAGQEAYAYAQTVCDTVATVTTGGLRVRSEANPDASVIKAASEGDKLVVDTQTESPEGWVAVSLKNSTAFVSADYVTVSLNVASAVSMEEERAALEEKAAEEAAKKAAEEAAKKAAQTTTTMVTQNASVAANCDEVTLLAALIQCEAGSECYEGQLAVGAVVMNRLRSGAYPSSLYDVIYQSGQFTPAGNGKVASVISSGVSGSCLQAAQEALSGVDNTGGALSFRRASSGQAGVVIGNHVFF